MVKKLLLFTPIFLLLLLPTNVFALPTLNETGYLISPCTGSQFSIGNFLWYYGSFPFYGWNGTSGTSNCPYTSQFYSQQKTVFVMETQGNFNQNAARGVYAIRFNLNRTLKSGDTYDLVVRFKGRDLTYYFNGASSVSNAQLLDNSLTCTSGNDCNLNLKIKVNSDFTVLDINMNSPSEGLNGYYFNSLVDELYYPKITYANSSVDTSGIENNQQTIINQNQTIINQNQTEINQNNDMLQKQQETNELLEQQQDILTDESTPDTNQDIEDMEDMIASDTPISDLITMPLTLINAYANGVNSTCSPVNLGNLYGTDLILPCINLEQRLGSNLWNIIDTLLCLFMCYNIGMLFVTAFDGITSLRDDFEGLYQPRHADMGYQPKHGGGN